MCVVADRGMISDETMAELEKRGIDYILGARERVDKEVQEIVLADAKPMVAITIPRARGKQTTLEVKGLTSISREIRSWALDHRSDKSLAELAQMYNPCNCGWITYYSHFYKTQLRPTLKRIDAYVIRWVRRKFKRES